MRIEVMQDFKHGRDLFAAGDVRTVSDEDGAYFVANKWAKPVGSESQTLDAPEPVTLEVQGGKHTAKGKAHG